jgi:hypothetical protein
MLGGSVRDEVLIATPLLLCSRLPARDPRPAARPITPAASRRTNPPTKTQGVDATITTAVPITIAGIAATSRSAAPANRPSHVIRTV